MKREITELEILLETVFNQLCGFVLLALTNISKEYGD